MYLVWMGHLALVICRTWHLDGLKLMSHRCSHLSRVKKSFCSVTDSSYFLFFLQYLMRVAQLAINNYSTLWPSKHITQYIHIYNIIKEQLNTRV